MKKYTPNWNDPRIIKRINKSIDYALANVSPTKARSWSTRQIDLWFGNQGNPLSKMIRQEFLEVTDCYYNPLTNISKKYRLNIQGVARLGNKINRNIIPCAVHLKSQRITAAESIYGNQITNGVFQYREVSNRMWNDLQNLDNDIRRPLFANYGYVHEYDIVSASPNILFQYAKQCGLTRSTNTITEYVNNPELYRKRLCDLLGVDRKTAKKLITSRFAGARFGARNSLLKQLDNRWILHDRLKADQWYADLTDDIKLMWDAIKTHNKFGRMTARIKWGIYFQEELRVMKSVHRFLDKQQVTYFHEHDGWRSNSAIPLRELKLHVQKQTGYWLEFDYDVYEK